MAAQRIRLDAPYFPRLVAQRSGLTIPLIFLSDLDKYTLALGLRFFQGQHRVEWTLLMAASLIILSPCIILFFIAQKNYIQGIVITGVKG